MGHHDLYCTCTINKIKIGWHPNFTHASKGCEDLGSFAFSWQPPKLPGGSVARRLLQQQDDGIQLKLYHSSHRSQVRMLPGVLTVSPC